MQAEASYNELEVKLEEHASAGWSSKIIMGSSLSWLHEMNANTWIHLVPNVKLDLLHMIT
jgi:hypothetical protein